MHNPDLSVTLQMSADGDINVVFRDGDGEIVFWFDDEPAMRKMANIAAWGLGLLADATVLGFDGATDFHGIPVEETGDG